MTNKFGPQGRFNSTRFNTLLCVLLAVAALACGAVSHSQQPSGERAGRARRMSRQAEERGLAEPFKGVTADGHVVRGYAGIRAAELTARQKELLLELIGEYVGKMRDGHAEVKMEEVRRHLDETRFAWVGGTAPDSVFYYRIHSPVVLIEFDHQTTVALRRLGRGRPTREHIRTVVRTPNGNDYGKDLLRQHYEQHPHPHKH